MPTFNGTSQDDTLNGGTQDDIINGFCGDDSLNGSSGADIINGGAGDDRLVGFGDSSNDVLSGGFGDDTFVVGLGDSISGGTGDEETGDYAALNYQFVNGFTPNNAAVYVDLRAANGDAAVALPSGATASGIEAFSVTTGGGNDTILLPTLGGGFFFSQAFSGAGNDVIVGGDGRDLLSAGTGADYLDGGEGADILNAGGETITVGTASVDTSSDLAVDTLVGGGGDDVLSGGAEDFFSGGSGTDTAFVDFRRVAGNQFVDLRGFAPGVTYGLAPAGGSIVGVEIITVATGAGTDNVLGSNLQDGALLGDGADIGVMAGGNDNVEGEGGADYLDGGDGDDFIVGGRSDESVSTFGAMSQPNLIVYFVNDLLSGHDDQAVDTLLGGAGNDMILFARGDFVNGGTGTDVAVIDVSAATASLYYDFRVMATAPFFPLDGGGGMSNMERVYIHSGSGNDTLIDTDLDGGAFGGDGNDILVGLGGSDILSGDDGADYLDGGDGDDALIGGDGIDQALGGGGNDVIALFDGGGNTEQDIGIAGAGDDVVDADAYDYLDGGAGFDFVAIDFDSYGNVSQQAVYFDFAPAQNGGVLGTIAGGSLRGFESGTVWGTIRNDTLLDADWNGGVFGGGGNDVIAGRGGNDGLSGGDGADYIDGGAGNDWIFGGAGIDTLLGGDGDDHIGDVDGLSDFVAALPTNNLIGGTVGAIDDNLLFEAFDDQDNSRDIASGGAGNDVIFTWDGDDYLDGGVGNDRLFGGGGNDELRGGDGNDWLDGGCGIDTLIGGAGADTFAFDRHADGLYGIITDFSAAQGDRFHLEGASFLGFVTGDFDGDGNADDTQLGFSGGNVVVLNNTGLSLDGWNALVIPGG